jgi:hypothetical protein
LSCNKPDSKSLRQLSDGVLPSNRVSNPSLKIIRKRHIPRHRNLDETAGKIGVAGNECRFGSPLQYAGVVPQHEIELDLGQTDGIVPGSQDRHGPLSARPQQDAGHGEYRNSRQTRRYPPPFHQSASPPALPVRHISDATGQTKEGLLQDVRIVSNLDLPAGTMSL